MDAADKYKPTAIKGKQSEFAFRINMFINGTVAEPENLSVARFLELCRVWLASIFHKFVLAENR